MLLDYGAHIFWVVPKDSLLAFVFFGQGSGLGSDHAFQGLHLSCSFPCFLLSRLVKKQHITTHKNNQYIIIHPELPISGIQALLDVHCTFFYIELCYFNQFRSIFT
jgi:hypothetical protein